MVDREKVVAVLNRRFPGAPSDQLAAAANAIMGLDDEWEELPRARESWMGGAPDLCRQACYLQQAALGGTTLRVFRRRFIE